MKNRNHLGTFCLRAFYLVFVHYRFFPSVVSSRDTTVLYTFQFRKVLLDSPQVLKKSSVIWYNKITNVPLPEFMTPDQNNFRTGHCCEFRNICPAAETKFFCDSFTLSSFLACQWSPLRGRRSSVEESASSSSITTEMNSPQPILLVSSPSLSLPLLQKCQTPTQAPWSLCNPPLTHGARLAMLLCKGAPQIIFLHTISPTLPVPKGGKWKLNTQIKTLTLIAWKRSSLLSFLLSTQPVWASFLHFLLVSCGLKSCFVVVVVDWAKHEWFNSLCAKDPGWHTPRTAKSVGEVYRWWPSCAVLSEV